MTMYHSVPGLEHATIVRNAYAIEYDCINPTAVEAILGMIKRSVDFLVQDRQMVVPDMKKLAAQGIIAGINAARKLQEKDPLILGSFTGIHRSFN